jgi:hypothetical protein
MPQDRCSFFFPEKNEKWGKAKKKFFFSKNMKAAKRFQEKLFLPKEYTFDLKKVLINLQPITEWVLNNNSIELYHATRNQDSHSVFMSMCTKGFRIGPACNKGYGVYLANHGRYSLFWGNRNFDGSRHVMVCRVKVSSLHQFHSEISSGNDIFCHEFVVPNPEDVWVSHYIEYNVTIPKSMKIPVFVEQFNCKVCFQRCDCELPCTMQCTVFDTYGKL